MSSCSDDDDDDFFDATAVVSAEDGYLYGAVVSPATGQSPLLPPHSHTSSRPPTSHARVSSRSSRTDADLATYSRCKEPPVPPVPSHFANTGDLAPLLPTALATSNTASATAAAHQFTNDEGLTPRPRSRARSGLRRALEGDRDGVDSTQVQYSALDRLEGNTAAGAVEGQGDMARPYRNLNGDVFQELGDGERANTLASRLSRRTSYATKRRSLPVDGSVVEQNDERPSTSGHASSRLSSRLQGVSNTSDLQHHVDRYRAPTSRLGMQADDARSVASCSRSTHISRYAMLPDRFPANPSYSTERVRSPEATQNSQRRPSSGATSAKSHLRSSEHFPVQMSGLQDESPVESSEPKMTDSASADSQTADTVWDELDDLKSRIKKLELTGKMPTSSSAAITGDSSERPRTATTAPTTIDSSPKHERKAGSEAEAKVVPSIERTVGGAGAPDLHPLLHAALAKAKPLVNPGLYRSLEATASDALQMAALTSSTGPTANVFSGASVVNGGTSVSDRQLRRKADNMCRNLTDLCLALCDGKHESPTLPSSLPLDSPNRESTGSRYPRASLSPGLVSTTRPMSRLEARRSSILGVQGGSTHASNEDVSDPGSGTPSIALTEARRVERVSSGFLRSRLLRNDNLAANDDDDPTLRPPSRAMTEAGGFLSRLRTKSKSPGQQRTPSSRESFGEASTAVRNRGSENTPGSERELTRVASFSSDPRRRRFYDHATPPVLEEDDDPDEPPPLPTSTSTSSTRRRITSFGLTGVRRAATDLAPPARATSLAQRRHVIVE